MVDRVQRGQLTAKFERTSGRFKGSEDRSFSIIVHDDSNPLGESSLDLICYSKEQFKMWYMGLSMLLKEIHRSIKRMSIDDLYLQSRFTKADKDGSGSLSKNEIIGLLTEMNVTVSIEAIEGKFKEVDVDKSGYLDFNEFRVFVHLIRRQ